MRFPHAVEILRPSGTDAYGNPNSTWTAPTRTAGSAFIVQKGVSGSTGEQSRTVIGIFPPDTDIHSADRLQHGDLVYEVIGEVVTASSPSRDVLRTATLREVNSG